MRRVLFIDDDPAVLAGLRRMLRSKRNEWDLTFADGGQGALETLARESFDVVITDMRMPGVGGIDILAHLRVEHPETVRIVLSGHTEQSSALRSASLAHRFLSKPCEPLRLIEAIDQACRLEQRLRNPELRRLVGQMTALPSPGQVVLDLNEALATPGTSIELVAEIVAGDVAISVKLLQLVNSAFFGLAQEVTSVRQAVAYLGTSLIRSLVAASEVFAFAHEVRPVPYDSVPLLHDHSLRVAQLAQDLAPPALGQDAFVAGLVHDVGALVLAAVLPDLVESIRDEVARGERATHVIETEHFGADHADVGAYLLSLWGLPYAVVEAVAHHHEPPSVGAEGLQLSHLVAIADAFVELDDHSGMSFESASPALDRTFLEACGLADRLLPAEDTPVDSEAPDDAERRTGAVTDRV